MSSVWAGCGRIGFTADADARADAAAGPGGEAGTPSCAGFDLCDQFEDPVLGSVWTAYGEVSHATLAHRGSGSLHFVVPPIGAGGMAGALIAESTTFATGTAPFWVRVWVRFGAHADVQNHLELLSADQFAGGGHGDYLFAEADETALYSQFDDRTSALPVPIPLDTWTCLIWHVAPDDGVMDLGGDLGSASYSGITNGEPPLSILGIGPNLDPTNVAVDQPMFEVWLDDVIVHHAAVTCAD
ncbi:MAG: hypothetical protein ABI467_18250 [Kofleriaceae bacterium]